MSLDLGRASLEGPTTPKASIDNTLTPQRTAPDPPPVENAETRARLDKVLQSDIGINTLLTRLKQSVSSARELSSFLKERAALEEKHATGISRLTQNTHNLLGRPENRQGSFAFNYREVGTIHDRMAKNSEDFAHNLTVMGDELVELAAHCEKGRKHWKRNGLEAEQRAQEADNAMEKAKARYFSLAEQYDRVRTGERQGAKFSLKGPKSSQQQEDSLLGKAESADQDYRSKVEAAQAQRRELLASSRPQATRELQNLILECDAGVSMQLQKFAVLNEKLLLGNGLCISPLKNQENGAPTGSRSLREVVSSINNQKDFEDFVFSHSGKVGPTPAEVRYEKHSALVSHPPHHHPQSSVSSNTFGGPPIRSDTGFNSQTGPVPQSGLQGGQMSGYTNNHPPLQQNPYSAPQPPTVSPAPQLPQIGALSMGGGPNLESDRSGLPPGRGAYENRNFTGPTQQRPGQVSPTGPGNLSTSPTINQQVTDDHMLFGSGSPRAQAATGHGVPSDAQSPHENYHYGNRGPSIGQQNDFRSDARNAPQIPPTGFRPDGRSPPQAHPSDFRQDGRGQPQPQPPLQDIRSEGRGPSQAYAQPGYHPGPRGLPSQNGQYSTPAYGGHGGHGGLGGHGGHGNTMSPVSVSSPTNGSSQMTSRAPANAPTAPASMRGPSGRPNLPPLRPVFGVSLDDLFRRDGAAVPAIVYQCVQAVDLFGLNTEGVYRISGSAQHISELQALFDHDSSQVDFRTPASFYDDIASVTTLLKHFLRDLPDPLLTSTQYSSFIQAGKIEDDIVRRDSLHAIINSLPDPNYATLRTLVLHLFRVAQRSGQNRMTTSNLAIVFGPTLMGGHGGGPGEIQDAGWQARVVETILNHTLEIFDDDAESG